MGYDDAVKRILEVGAEGVLARPDALYDMLVGVVSKLGEFEGLKHRVGSLEEVGTAHNEQINNAKRAINLLYKQGGGAARGQEAATPMSAASIETPATVAPSGLQHIEDQISAANDRLDRLDRLHDIMSERMSINQALLQKIKTLDEVVLGRQHEGHGMAETLTQHGQAIFQMEQRVDGVIDNIYQVSQKMDSGRTSPVDDQLEPVRKELKHVEKKLVTALSNVATRVSDSSYEIDRLRAQEEGVVHARMKEIEHTLGSLQRGCDGKADHTDLDRVRDEVVNRCDAMSDEVGSLFKLFDLNKRDVVWAVQSSNPSDKLQVLHALPCFAGLTLAVSRLNPQPHYSQLQPPPSPSPPSSPRGKALAVMPAHPSVTGFDIPASRSNASGTAKQFPVVGLEIVDGPGPGTGVRVVSVLSGSPAALSGMHTGDRILSFNGTPTDTRSTFMEAALRCLPGTRAALVRITPLAPSVPEHVDIVLGGSGVAPSGVHQLRRQSTAYGGAEAAVVPPAGVRSVTGQGTPPASPWR